MLRYYDLYQRLQLHFYVLLMMGSMDTRNMYSDFIVNKYLHTVASCWILLVIKNNSIDRESVKLNVHRHREPPVFVFASVR